jgi:IS5 family transposase
VQELIASPSDALARLLPDFGKQLAIDSTIVLAYSNPDKQTKAGGLSDPEASWTTKSYKKGAHLEGKESRKEWFFGYKLHILADSFWELPIAVKVTTAKESDSPHLIPLLRKAREQHQWLHPEVVSADAGYDGINNYQGISAEFNATPIIDIRDMGRKSAWAYYNQQGIPYCLGRKLMEYVGSNAQGHIYRCVAAKCHLQGEEGTPYCEYVITVQPGDDLRKIGPVARVSAQWKKLFSRRSAVERVNSWLKGTRRLQDFCFRRLRKVTAHCLLSVLTLQASAVAQARMGGLVGVR